MKIKTCIACLIMALSLVSCEELPDMFDGVRTGLIPSENDFIHAEGSLLKDDQGSEFKIKSVSFGNDVWANLSVPSDFHHNEDDYRRLSEMGFNTVRFYLNYKLFEDDNNPYVYKKSGFDWLDKNIKWASSYNIKLFLNMHVPQGGFQSNGDGDKLWTNSENQKRFIALWKEIAKHYAEEEVILGYDILNEPYVTESIGQWMLLVKNTVIAIRQIDQKHIIAVERMNANKACSANNYDYNQNGEMNYFMVNDNNILYEFHYYSPIEFTHQFAEWIPSLKDKESFYPDNNKGWKKTAMEKEIDSFTDFATKNNVPVFMGEFGLMRHCYLNNRGGLIWVRDLMNIAINKNINYSYHAWNDYNFGIYCTDTSCLPDEANANDALIMLFKEIQGK